MPERTKLVVRHLPPNLPEHVFWKTLSPWIDPIPNGDDLNPGFLPPRCSVNFKHYVPGKVRKNKSKVDVPSRAYITFATSDQVVEFHQGYAHQAFRDSRGHVTYPKVEFAPYQKSGGPPKRVDPRVNTIESDQTYIAFLKRLEDPSASQETDGANGDHKVDEAEAPQPSKITPLIEHLRNVRKAEQEASLAAKQHQKQQQRQASSNPSAASKFAAARPLATQPQIMKRVMGSNANQPTGSSSSKNSSNPTAAAPPTSGSSKPSQAQKISSSTPVSLSAPATSASASARPASPGTSSKPQKSKKPPREPGNQQALHGPTDVRPNKPHSTKSRSASTKASSSPKKTPAVASESQDSETVSSRGMALSGQQLEGQVVAVDAAPEDHKSNSSRGGRQKGGRGSLGGRGGGGGRGGMKNITPSPSSNTPTHPSAASSSTPTKSRPPAEPRPSQPNQSETAAARRRLGMALAGIANSRPKEKKQKKNEEPPSQ